MLETDDGVSNNSKGIIPHSMEKAMLTTDEDHMDRKNEVIFDMCQMMGPLRLDRFNTVLKSFWKIFWSTNDIYNMTRLKTYNVQTCDVAMLERKIQSCKDRTRMGAQNINSVKMKELNKVKDGLNQLHVDILGFSELKWTGMGYLQLQDHPV